MFSGFQLRELTPFRALIRGNLHSRAGLAVIEATIRHTLASKMFPCRVASDVADRGVTNIKVVGYRQMLFASFQALDDFKDLRFVKFCVGVLRSFLPKSSTQHVEGVEGVSPNCCPFKILDSVVGLDAVFMIGNERISDRRPNEGLKNVSVNRPMGPLAANLPRNGVIASTQLKREHPTVVNVHPIAPRRNLLHSTMRTYFIQTFETRHWKPLFIAHAR